MILGLCRKEELFLYGMKFKYNVDLDKKYIKFQEDDWDCWLSSIYTILNLLNVKYKDVEFLLYLYNLGLKYSFEYGGYFTYIGLVLVYYNIPITIYIPEKILYELKLFTNIDIKLEKKNIYSVLINMDSKNPRRDLYLSILILLQKKVSIYFIKDKHFIYYRLIYTKRKYFIAQVSSREFYNVNDDDSSHIIILFRKSYNTFNIFDTYEKRAQENFDDWIKMKESAIKYNWENWNSWLLIIDK